MSDTVFLGTVVHTPSEALPFPLTGKFNDRASDLLAVAERIIFAECCENGCISYKDELEGHPTSCLLFVSSKGAPLSCCAFMAARGDAS